MVTLLMVLIPIQPRIPILRKTSPPNRQWPSIFVDRPAFDDIVLIPRVCGVGDSLVLDCE